MGATCVYYRDAPNYYPTSNRLDTLSRYHFSTKFSDRACGCVSEAWLNNIYRLSIRHGWTTPKATTSTHHSQCMRPVVWVGHEFIRWVNEGGQITNAPPIFFGHHTFSIDSLAVYHSPLSLDTAVLWFAAKSSVYRNRPLVAAGQSLKFVYINIFLSSSLFFFILLLLAFRIELRVDDYSGIDFPIVQSVYTHVLLYIAFHIDILSHIIVQSEQFPAIYE